MCGCGGAAVANMTSCVIVQAGRERVLQISVGYLFAYDTLAKQSYIRTLEQIKVLTWLPWLH